MRACSRVRLPTMLKSLQRAVAEAERQTPETQQDLARLIMLYLREEQLVVDLTPEQEAAVLRSRDAARRGEFASDKELKAIWANLSKAGATAPGKDTSSL